jgi:hypothetical protein
MAIPQIIKKLLSQLDDQEINNTIYDYYRRFGSNPILLNGMIKTYISSIINDKLDSWTPIKNIT